MRHGWLVGLALLASTALADVTFNVVGYPDTVTGCFGVSVNGQVTKLVTNSTTYPLWSGSVAGVTGSSPYKYVKLDEQGATIQEEPFTRTLEDPNALKTPNEFFDREITHTKLPDVPLVYTPTFPSKTKIFDDSQIATFHLTADPGQFQTMVQTPEGGKAIKVNVRYINSRVVHNVNNVTFKISGKSSTEFNKQAFKLKFDKKANQTFFHRPSIKLRSESSDPTLMREKLYIDMLNTMGVPTQQGAWVRLYVNDKPIGLYLMVDDIGKSFLKQTIHGGDDKVVRGSLFQMNAPLVEQQADLRYLGPDAASYPDDCYKNKVLGNNPILAPMTQLIQLMKDLSDFTPNAPNAVDFWNQRLDLEGFLRNMAMEYLAGSWDAYWWSGSNYLMYFNPVMAKWQWISTDFDGTFGDGDPTDTLTTYQAYADFSQHDRPMITKLILQDKEINAMFEKILKETVGWAFKPEGLFPRIDAYEKMLAKEAAWEYSIDRSGNPGKTNAWTVNDFHQSLVGAVKDMNLGVRPWIEGRTRDLQAQLGFTVEPGHADRVKRPAKRPQGGQSDADVEASAVRSGGASILAGSWVPFACTAAMAVISMAMTVSV